MHGSAISVSHDSAMVSAMSKRPRRSGELTLTPLRPKRLFESLNDCSIYPLCQYHEAALFALLRLVARYHGSSGCLRGQPYHPSRVTQAGDGVLHEGYLDLHRIHPLVIYEAPEPL